MISDYHLRRMRDAFVEGGVRAMRNERRRQMYRDEHPLPCDRIRRDAIPLPDSEAGGFVRETTPNGSRMQWSDRTFEVSTVGKKWYPVFDRLQNIHFIPTVDAANRCDHIRHQWRGVDLPCAVPGCVDGIKGESLYVVTQSPRWWMTSVKELTLGDVAGGGMPRITNDDAIEIRWRFTRENLLGWGWRLA